MYFIDTGSLAYLASKVLQWSDPARKIVLLSTGRCVSEACLWMSWVHRGSMMAVVECTVGTLDAKKFEEVSASYPAVLPMCQRHALHFLADMIAAIEDGDGEAPSMPE